MSKPVDVDAVVGAAIVELVMKEGKVVLYAEDLCHEDSAAIIEAITKRHTLSQEANRPQREVDRGDSRSPINPAIRTLKERQSNRTGGRDMVDAALAVNEARGETWLSTARVAQLLGYTTTQGVRDFARRTGLPTYKIGRKLLFNSEELEKHIRRGEVARGCWERGCTIEEGERHGSQMERIQEDETPGRAQRCADWSVPVTSTAQMPEDRQGPRQVTLVHGGNRYSGSRRASLLPGRHTKNSVQPSREEAAGDPYGLRRALDCAEEE